MRVRSLIVTFRQAESPSKKEGSPAFTERFLSQKKTEEEREGGGEGGRKRKRKRKRRSVSLFLGFSVSSTA